MPELKALIRFNFILSLIINVCLLGATIGLITWIWFGTIGCKITLSSMIIWIPAQTLWRHSKGEIEKIKERG